MTTRPRDDLTRGLPRAERKRMHAGRFAPFRACTPPSGGSGWFGEVTRVWSNDWFVVLGRDVRTKVGEVLHLAIRNAPNTDIPWAEKMWIKNSIAGESAYAVEVFPSADRLIDEANMYHIWVLQARLPFGIHSLDERDK